MVQHYFRTWVALLFGYLIAASLCAPTGWAQQSIPDEVLDIFDDRCAFSGCHVGTSAPKGVDLTEDFVLASLVSQPSSDNSKLILVKPKDPVNSYLIMKLRGSTSIKGERMPKSGDPLSEQQINTIEAWINSLPANMKVETPQREYTEAFVGLSLATLPTPETLEQGLFSYRIAHRWRGEVGDGFSELFGLDAGAGMLTQLSFRLAENLMFTVARTSENATFEFAGKWRVLREKTDGSVPISAAVVGGLDWATRKTLTGVVEELNRSDSERFHWFGQVALSKQLGERFSVLLVPGILINGNAQIEDEDAIITLGFAGKFMIIKDFSIFVEGVPILSGDEGAEVVAGRRLEGNELVYNDAFTIGLEKRVGGHVFHVYITNSLGLTTNQYMSGANLDFTDGDFRLGFNIYRTLRFPF